MDDVRVFQLAPAISCHAWNRDRSKLAICPNSNEIWIYSGCHASESSQWRKEAVLTEHDMLVSGLDWSPVHDQLVSCSHDRSAFVWKYDASYRQWKPLLVVLRVTRAAINVKWSPDGNILLNERDWGGVDTVQLIARVCLYREEVCRLQRCQVCVRVLLPGRRELVG